MNKVAQTFSIPVDTTKLLHCPTSGNVIDTFNMNDYSGHAAILHIRKLLNPKLTTCVISIALTIIYN